jgi:outer membrane protein W
MKNKTIFALLFALTLSMASYAQTGKNTFFFGSSAGMSGNYGKSATINGTTVDGAKSFNMSLTPRLGYFFTNNVAAGLEMDFTHRYSKGGENSARTNQILAGPFARFYAPLLENRAAAFLFGSLGFGTAGNSSEGQASSATLLGIGFGPGLSFFATERVGLETQLRFDFVNTTATANEQTAVNNATGVNLQVGVHYYIGR